MNPAITGISGSSIPCVVTDGVPMRTPLVTNGLRGSSGIVFLFSVMPASSSVAWAILPVSSPSNGVRSTTIMWVSVPPETRRNPSPARAEASAEALETIWCAYFRKLGCIASRKAMALPAMTCSSGPPCQPGNTALSIAFACSAVERMQPPRGPRSVLCVVKVTTSEYGTGFGCAPPATRPARWAMSNSRSAPTSSAIDRNASGSRRRGYEVVPATIIFGRCSRASSRTWSIWMRSSAPVP